MADHAITKKTFTPLCNLYPVLTVIVWNIQLVMCMYDFCCWSDVKYFAFRGISIIYKMIFFSDYARVLSFSTTCLNKVLIPCMQCNTGCFEIKCIFGKKISVVTIRVQYQPAQVACKWSWLQEKSVRQLIFAICMQVK